MCSGSRLRGCRLSIKLVQNVQGPLHEKESGKLEKKKTLKPIEGMKEIKGCLHQLYPGTLLDPQTTVNIAFGRTLLKQGLPPG